MKIVENSGSSKGHLQAGNFALAQYRIIANAEMKMTDKTEIRRTQGGSIDTPFYMARGHQVRSDALLQMVHALLGLARGTLRHIVRRTLARRNI